MAFPEKSFLGFTVGWQDLGEIDYSSIVEDGKTIRSWTTHAYCNTKVHIGKENGELFKFCPKCFIKISENKE
jgi:hypothetical protein